MPILRTVRSTRRASQSPVTISSRFPEAVLPLYTVTLFAAKETRCPGMVFLTMTRSPSCHHNPFVRNSTVVTFPSAICPFSFFLLLMHHSESYFLTEKRDYATAVPSFFRSVFFFCTGCLDDFEDDFER